MLANSKFPVLFIANFINCQYIIFCYIMQAWTAYKKYQLVVFYVFTGAQLNVTVCDKGREGLNGLEKYAISEWLQIYVFVFTPMYNMWYNCDVMEKREQLCIFPLKLLATMLLMARFLALKFFEPYVRSSA